MRPLDYKSVSSTSFCSKFCFTGKVVVGIKNEKEWSKSIWEFDKSYVVELRCNDRKSCPVENVNARWKNIQPYFKVIISILQWNT